MPEADDGVQYYPLDVTKLSKGQTLEIADLEHVFGLKWAPDNRERWQFRLMEVQGQIRTERDKRELPVLTTYSRKGTLHICTDAEAADYNNKMGRRGIRRFKRATVRNLAVDTSKLTDEQKRDHERALAKQAMLSLAIRKVECIKALTSDGTTRTTPRMVAGPAL